MAQRITNPDEGILLSELARVDPQLLTANDLFTGLHNGVNANFRLVDVASYVAAGIDLNPGEPPEWHPPDPITGEYVTYSVLIDHSKTDPYKMVEYADDALNLNGTWERAKTMPIFKKLKNCVLKDGVVQYYLDRDDVTKDEDGNDVSAEITTLGNDVMLEFPERLGYRFHWETGDILKVSVTNRPAAAGFNYDPFSYLDYNDCNKVYLGRYLTNLTNQLAYSASAQSRNQRNMQEHQNCARARGVGYDTYRYSIRTLYLCLCLICFKHLDLQRKIGLGGTSGTNGSANKYGWYNQIQGVSSNSNPISLLGLESPWGLNMGYPGIRFTRINDPNISMEYIYIVQTENYSSAGPEWENSLEVSTVTTTPGTISYLQRPVGTNKLGFFPAVVANGSSSVQYTDIAEQCSTKAPDSLVGNGFYSTGSSDYAYGPFNLFWTNNNYLNTSTYQRLMYFHRG